MSAEIIATLVMGVALAVLIHTQFHGFRFGIAGLRDQVER